MLSVSRSLITKIKNRKLSITTIKAKGLAENPEAAWHSMMDEMPATLDDNWLEMRAEQELEFVEDVESFILDPGRVAGRQQHVSFADRFGMPPSPEASEADQEPHHERDNDLER